MRLSDLNPSERQRWPGTVGPHPKIGEQPFRVLNSDWVDWDGHIIVDEEGIHFIGYDTGHVDPDHPQSEDNSPVHFQMDLKMPSQAAAELLAQHLPSRMKYETMAELGFELEEAVFAKGWRYLGPTLARKRES